MNIRSTRVRFSSTMHCIQLKCTACKYTFYDRDLYLYGRKQVMYSSLDIRQILY